MIVGSVTPVVAIMTRAMRENQPVEGEMVGHEEYSSEDPPHLSDLGKVVRAARRATKDFNHVKDVPGGKGSFAPLETGESVMSDWEGPGIPPEEFEPEGRKKGEREENHMSYGPI